MVKMVDMQRRLVVQFQNKGKQARLIRLEPWGDEQLIAPEQTLEITADGPSVANLRLEIDDDSATFWGWEGSTLNMVVVND